MALKVELKPGERIILGECVITNDDQRTRLLIEGHVPILREKDILTVERADTPAKRIYLAVQLMYTSKDPRTAPRGLFRAGARLPPGRAERLAVHREINNHILTGELYKALKAARKLIAYEQELLNNAKRGASLRSGREADRHPRELEAQLLLKAAARLQAIHDAWEGKRVRARRARCSTIASSGRSFSPR